MAIVGQVLTAPENGWRRYDQKDSRILFSNGTWNTDNANSPAYNGSQATSNSLGATCTFKFKGSKIRLIGTKDSSFSNNIDIYIDNVLETTISENYTSNVFQILLFEKTGLTNATHTIKFVNKTTNYIVIDAIDMDDIGDLLHPILNQVSDINTMQVGDCIPCRYTATTSGSAGIFSELGSCTANEIPVSGTATPDGLVHLIKTDKGTLVADRIVQIGISWDTLNTAKYIEGKSLLLSNKNVIFRSLSGGVAYIDANGNSSLTDKSLGAWPSNNEWDKYIVNSDLGGKIIKGDDNIWHWNNNKAAWMRNTPVNGLNRGDGWLGQNDRRIHNKLTTIGEIKGRSYSISSYVGSEIGFRPVLNYVETDIASEVIY